MHGSNRPKQADPRPQRRCRFHCPRQARPQRRRRFQLAHLTGPQRRHRFHGQPANATGDTTTKPHTDLHETHNTNARRPTLTFETHNTNARLKPPKTGPFTPAKAMPVSRPTRERNRWHHHKALDSRHRDLSTGVMLNASYPQGHNSSFSFRSRRAIIHQSGPYPQLHMVVSNCYLNSSHPSDRRFALLAFMERKCSCIASERTATF